MTQQSLQSITLGFFAVVALSSCTLLKEIQQDATQNKEPELTDDSVPLVLSEQRSEEHTSELQSPD